MSRLIDADKLYFSQRFALAAPEGNKMIPVLAVDKKWVDEAPAVDAVEVVHGRWIEKQEPLPWCEDEVDMFWECSVCECRNFEKSPYCPNCGAKMNK